MKYLFDDDWKHWIWSNINNGVPKDVIYDKLIENDFDRFLVINEIRYNPLPKATASIDSKNGVINQLTYLGAERIDAPIPLFKFDQLLTESECDELISIHREINQPSTTGQKSDAKVDVGRISFSTFYEHKGLLKTRKIVQTLKFKVLGLLGLPIYLSEPIQGQWYKVGGFYNNHFDAVHLPEKVDEKIGNRTWTCFINLNEPEEGGDTYFPKLDMAFKPKKGQALIWYNLGDDNLAHPLTLHTGRHVTKGEKFIVTQWFHQYPRELGC